MGKIKRFFKHIEKFFVRRKQQLIMHHLLYHAGGKGIDCPIHPGLPARIRTHHRNFTDMDMLVAGRKRNAGYRKSLLQRHAPVFRRAPGHSHYGKEL